MPEQFGDKTHEATPHRRQQAREKGQVVKSMDLSSAGVLLGGLLIIYGLSAGLFDSLAQFMTTQLSELPSPIYGQEEFAQQSQSILDRLTRDLLPLLSLMLGAAILLNVGQTGLLFTPSRIAPDLSRINPIKGFTRVFSLSGVMRLGFGIFKILIVAGVAFLSIYARRGEMLLVPEWSPVEVGIFLLDILFWTAVKIAAALMLLAILDYWYQRWKHDRDLKMTTQEVRDEMKNLQGDPQVAARRKQVQRQLVLNRLGQDVPKADVVVTNPTHLAVAIQYEPMTMNAPIIVAKGQGSMAERIRRIALEHQIPVLERKPLAQALYHNVEVNQPIPADHYASVAEILRYVYELKGKTLTNAA
ncbi:MAG: flagellar biosynthesis protein FlhB [Pirellulales bacterium]|nr:flagellar biosynthesis protein FlhB [Pirellulales bacterium]